MVLAVRRRTCVTSGQVPGVDGVLTAASGRRLSATRAGLLGIIGRVSSVYRDKPWLARYRAGQPDSIAPEYGTMLEAFRASLARDPAAVAIRYFDGSLTLGDLDRASSALAAVLVARGFRPGDRLALYLQNNPAFVVGLLGAWKAGGAAVAVNPMNKHRELLYLLSDSGGRVRRRRDPSVPSWPSQLSPELLHAAPNRRVCAVRTASARCHARGRPR